MIRAEYIRFLQTLSIDDDSANVRKMANLVLQNLEILIPLSTAQGQRIKKMVLLAQESWHSLNSDIQVIQEHKSEQICQITRLKSLSVGPFRGFAKQEYFDLSSQFVLLYGPNGTGKSSFCEALEYGLLGTVTEAENKRFRTQDYLKNAHAKSFLGPILVGVDGQGDDIRISANEALYRFCFVEKNRIDNFSRIAAQTPAKQTDLISTLFGLDAFTDFVGDFTETMDGKYIDLEGAKIKELEKKRLTLSGYQQQLKDTIPQQIKAIETDEQALATEYNEGCLFFKMVEDLHGSEETDGLIKQLEEKLQKQLPTKSNLTVPRLATLKESIEVAIKDRNEKQTELSTASQKVSFKQLYEAVAQLKGSNSEQCPACQTPLSQVTVNPFVHAETELKTLQHLSQLQEALKVLDSTLDTSVRQLSEIIKSCCSYYSDTCLSTVPVSGEIANPITRWRFLHQKLEDRCTLWQHLEVQVKELEGLDKEIAKDEAGRSEEQVKLNMFREFSKKIVKLQARRDVATKSRNDAEEAIKNFDTENAQLITGVEAEKATVAQNQVIANAYDAFVQSINSYKNSLPSKLVADLGETVVQLYNAFNRNDAEQEKLARIILPLIQSERLRISFKKAPEDFHDALHVLSEGHIRCVGLAILAAKNIKENCPFVIFDDPVNAIDDDHREAIRRTLFDDIFFNDKQIVLACHGEEFLKDIQNLLSGKKASESKIVSFLPKNGDPHVRVDHNGASRNYILTAREYYNRNQIRDALGTSRQALESLTKGKVWRYVNKYGDGNLSIKMSSVKSPIELRNLTEQLKSKISKSEFSEKNKAFVLGPIDSLLGVSGESKEWRYLNKGTHDESDRPEFERGTVEKILIAVEALDAAFG